MFYLSVLTDNNNRQDNMDKTDLQHHSKFFFVGLIFCNYSYGSVPPLSKECDPLRTIFFCIQILQNYEFFQIILLVLFRNKYRVLFPSEIVLQKNFRQNYFEINIDSLFFK